MASYNKVIMAGNLTRDPEVKYLPSNTAVCKFGLATNHSYTTKEGEKRDEVCFVDCTLFGQGAEVFGKYMTKGRMVLIEGRLALEKWEDKEGKPKSKHSILVNNFTFLGGGKKSKGDSPNDPGPSDDEIPF